MSGHEESVKGKYKTINHLTPKDSTGKWFLIFLIPVILGVILGSIFGAMSFALEEGAIEVSSWSAGSIALAGILGIAAIIVGIYILYEMAITVSGHESVYEKYEGLEHLEKKESTVKWIIFGIIPILNLYFLWKMSEVISGHESVYE